MKPPILIFLLAVAMAVTLLVAIFVGEPEDGHGFAHPEIEHLMQGGDSAARHSAIIWVGWIYGVIQIVFFIVCLAMGSKRRDQSHPLRVPMIVGTLLFIAVWTALVISYRTYMVDGPGDLFGAFPIPTAWMIYGLWPIPVFFVGLFLIRFDRDVYNESDRQKFEAIMRENEKATRNSPE